MLLIQWLKEERGRGAALARHLRIPASMVVRMGGGGKQVPLEHCPDIQQFTAGAVTCEELRPDKAEYFALIRSQAAANETPSQPPPGAAVALPKHHDTLERRRVSDIEPHLAAGGV